MPAEATFGTWIKRRRKAHDLTQGQLARRVGCAASLIQKLEAGVRRPSRQIAALLATALDIPHDQLATFLDFARSGQPAPPALRPPANLPAPPTPLIGRDDDTATVRARLLRDDTRLLTLIGPPGIGKTRLGLAVAAAASDHFDDGVCFVALAPVRDPELVAPTIAQALGLQEFGGLPLAQRLINHVRERSMLLTLDNFEQVLAAAPLIAQLLAACPLLKILATSRAALRIRGERRYVVSPLALPPLSPHPAAPSSTWGEGEQAGVLVQNLPLFPAWERGPGGEGDPTQYAAVQLFADRAQAVRPDFTIAPTDAPAVAAICHRLDGLPLAIELVAARVRVLSPQALLERLSGRLLLETDGLRDADERQRTLHDAIEWSYNLLSGTERALFARLAVFSGGCTLEAAEAVCTDREPRMEDGRSKIEDRSSIAHPLSSIVDGLAALVDKSLLQRRDGLGGEPRFTMLETIREYALERLELSGEAQAVRRQHAAYYLALGQAAEPQLRGPQQVSWMVRLELEHNNLRAVLAWSKSAAAFDSQAGALGARLAVAIWEFWSRRGYLSEGRRWLAGALSQVAADPAEQEARALRARVLSAAGNLAVFHGDAVAGRALLQESLALFQDLGDSWGSAFVFLNLGVSYQHGDPWQAKRLAEQSLAIFRTLGDQWGIGWTLGFVAVLDTAGPADAQDQGARTMVLLEEGLAHLEAVEDIFGIATMLNALGGMAAQQGDDRRARVLIAECLALLLELGSNFGVGPTLMGFARIVAAQGQQRAEAERAARLYGAAEALEDSMTDPSHMLANPDGIVHQRTIAMLRTQLGEAAFATAWAAGRAMTLEQAVAYALEAGVSDTAEPVRTASSPQ